MRGSLYRPCRVGSWWSRSKKAGRSFRGVSCAGRLWGKGLRYGPYSLTHVNQKAQREILDWKRSEPEECLASRRRPRPPLALPHTGDSDRPSGDADRGAAIRRARAGTHLPDPGTGFPTAGQRGFESHRLRFLLRLLLHPSTVVLALASHQRTPDLPFALHAPSQSLVLSSPLSLLPRPSLGEAVHRTPSSAQHRNTRRARGGFLESIVRPGRRARLPNLGVIVRRAASETMMPRPRKLHDAKLMSPRLTFCRLCAHPVGRDHMSARDACSDVLPGNAGDAFALHTRPRRIRALDAGAGAQVAL